MNTEFYIETRAFRSVNNLYPNAQMGINKCFSKELGWVTYKQAIEIIGNPEVYSVRELIRNLQKCGFSKVNLNIKKNNKLVVLDYPINKLVKS